VLYIEKFYNQIKWMHSALGYLTPKKYEHSILEACHMPIVLTLCKVSWGKSYYILKASLLQVPSCKALGTKFISHPCLGEQFHEQFYENARALNATINYGKQQGIK
jgi:hypothetical protein